MTSDNLLAIGLAKQAAIAVLLHNSKGPFQGLPRTAGWGYPEPYTRDLMFSVLGIVVSGNAELLTSIRQVLDTLAKTQTEKGHIPSLVHDSENRGASDTTPLFLLATEIFRKTVKEPDFLDKAVKKSLLWMEYQSPKDRCLVAQQPTSDWRDEQWVLGYGLYVNTLVYSYLQLMGFHKRARQMHQEMEEFILIRDTKDRPLQEDLVTRDKPYYAFWTYKNFKSERFDLLGNSLAILSGMASSKTADAIIEWVENECTKMKARGILAVDLPPNFYPFINPEDPDWHKRYADYNLPGNYHNGGVWPFICGLYVASLVAAEKYELAEIKLLELTKLIKAPKTKDLEFGFNEWFKSQTGQPMGQDWQTWSAAIYLYAVKCVEEKRTLFFDEIREASFRGNS
ncbi:alkaline and neutral invertase-like protein [Salegentibacter sp. 24]|uniref:glycoside hydrolase 100 family protein n=1 Tax=Salegentibacter sp. 24 TaxID=2183986 RepID=UPI00105B7ED0|nr:glycoside hydrolase 100 family protein [Salegentibacter sp. 24]TDN86389.1 alkaline and neutral invertase-like protein [Salegentibacter sp. 24]